MGCRRREGGLGRRVIEENRFIEIEQNRLDWVHGVLRRVRIVVLHVGRIAREAYVPESDANAR